MARKAKVAKIKSSKEIIGEHQNFTPGICIICGASVEKKRDKRKKMYVRCALCGTMMFLSTINSEIGYQILEGVVSQDIIGYQNEIHMRLAKIYEDRSKQIEKRAIDKEISSIDRELGLKLPKM